MKTEFEINKRLAELLGWSIVNEDPTPSKGLLVVSSEDQCRAIDYCNNPNDIWPVIFNLRISIEPISHGAWRISDAWGLNAKSTSVPLRGAALVAIKILESRL